MRASFLVVLLVVSCALVVEGRTISRDHNGGRNDTAERDCQGKFIDCNVAKRKLDADVETLKTRINAVSFKGFNYEVKRMHLEIDVEELKYQIENPGAQKRFIAHPEPQYAGSLPRNFYNDFISSDCGENLSRCSERVTNARKEMKTLRGMSRRRKQHLKENVLKVRELTATKKQLTEQLKTMKQNKTDMSSI